MDSVSNKKVDTKEFNNFLKNINDRFETVEGRVNELEESLTKLMKRFDKQLPTSMMQKQVDELKESFNSFTESAQNAIKILSDFSDMVSASANKPKKIGLEIDKAKIEEVEKLIAKLNSDNILNGESSLKINTATATKQLSELYDKYTDLSSKMQESKKPEEIQNLQIELAKLLPQMSDLVNRIITIKKLNASELSEGLAGKISVGSIEDFSALFHFIESEIGTASNNLSRLRDTAKASASNVAEDITTEVSSFTFKNGGVRIPVTVDASSATALQTKYNEIVSALQEYADNHPVNVTMRLFPLNVNRSSAEEITNEMRRIQTDINSIEDEGLKTKLNSLYDDLESQFKKALNLKIKVDLGETEQSAKLRIKELQDAIKAQGLTITPTFDLSKADKEAIVSKLKEIQKSSKLNIGSELKTATKTLESLVTGDQAQKWSDNFATSLGKVYDKLEKLDPYIQSINEFVKTAKLDKTNIISDADVKNITALAEGIKSLSSAIDKIAKLDLTKFDTSGIAEKIQESVNGEKPVLIPIDPDLSNIFLI